MANEKYIGESKLKDEPIRRFVFTITDGAVTPAKLSTTVVTEVIQPIVNTAKEDLQNQVESLERNGIALSSTFGQSPYIGISQKTISEAIDSMQDAVDAIQNKQDAVTVEDETLII